MRLITFCETSPTAKRTTDPKAVHEPLELHGLMCGLHWYGTVLSAILLNHLAACCWTSSVPGFWGVCCRYHCAPELRAHLKTHNQENPFYFLILDWNHLFLHCSVHLMLTQCIVLGGKTTLRHLVLKRRLYRYIFSNEQNPQMQCGLHQKEVFMRSLAWENKQKQFYISFFYFHIKVSKSCISCHSTILKFLHICFHWLLNIHCCLAPRMALSSNLPKMSIRILIMLCPFTCRW